MMNVRTIDTLLVANRGEIACRVMRTAHEMGISTVAVHSDVDAKARHVKQADQAVSLGGVKPVESYLVIEKIIAAAAATGAQAIHPGYGFLSENVDFARAIEAAGLIFVGPPASAIDAMGSKSAAKRLMETAGVPLVPGYHGEDQDIATFREAANRIGYPVLLKAVAGGGGKGMKVVEHESSLAESLASAQREALSAFGNERMLIEKYVLQPRHIEIQVFADQQGNCVYLHERDCSIQRRHQKVVEEAPAPGLSPALRRSMGEAAVKAAQAIGYVGAGTVEFLLDARGHFYFMEMNTRLQVEHPVTEAITGLDLVAWQIRVARGEPLPLTQEQIPLIGHAMEVRLYAEDTDNGFLPASGVLDVYREAAPGAGRRVDSGVTEGDEISPFYDPMLGKIIAWGNSREEARLRLLTMLRETAVGGFANNLSFLQKVLSHPSFVEGGVDTGFIPDHETDLIDADLSLSDDFWKIAAEAWMLTSEVGTAASIWTQLPGWRSGSQPEIDLHLICDGHKAKVRLSSQQRSRMDGTQLTYDLNGVRRSTVAIRKGAALYLSWEGRLKKVTKVDPIAEAETSLAPQGGLSAPMNGSIVRVLIEAGDLVEAGSPLVVLEAMKMEHTIRAPQAGIVKAIFCIEGELISDGTPLVDIEAA